MDSESGAKPEAASTPVAKPKVSRNWVFVIFRVIALCGTISATLVMSLNKEKKTLLVATIGTNPIYVTLEAKFSHTPAFVFFVVVHAIGSLHNLLMLGVELFGHKVDFKGVRLMLITLADMASISLLAIASGAAASIAQLGKNGNTHARWNKICDKFGDYCDRGGGALIAAFIAIVFMMLLNAMSIVALHKKSTCQSSVVP